jgi:hypothetical protein
LPVVLVGLAAVAIGAWALLRRPSVRRRVEEITQGARERIETMRASEGQLDVESDQPTNVVGFEAQASSDADGFVNATEDAGGTTPGATDDVPAFEEAGKPS